MQVGLVTGKKKLDLLDFPDPEPAPGKAVVDVAYCGICGTDLHAYLSGDAYNPAICGHEWMGHVSAVGDAAPFKEGDRVAVGIAGACGQCASCRRGDAEHCDTAFMGVVGMGTMAAPHGGFASRIAMDAARLYHVDALLSDEEAGILEPATVAIHAVRRTAMRLGDSVVVMGAGPIGLLVLQCAKAAGAGTAVVIEPQPSRRELAGSLGADLLIDPANEDAQERVDAHIGATGADVVFECAGIPRTIDIAVKLARRGGAVTLVGVPNLPAQISASQWLMKEVRLSTSLAYRREEFAVTQGLVMDGRLRLAPLHTSTVSLAGMEGAFARLADDPREVKILVDPRA